MNYIRITNTFLKVDVNLSNEDVVYFLEDFTSIVAVIVTLQLRILNI